MKILHFAVTDIAVNTDISQCIYLFIFQSKPVCSYVLHVRYTNININLDELRERESLHTVHRAQQNNNESKMYISHLRYTGSR